MPTEVLVTNAYVQYRAAIHTYAFRLLSNWEDADDVTQEVFIRMHRRQEQLRDAASLRPWLYSIATNLCMDQLCRRASTRKVLGIRIAVETSEDADARGILEIADLGSADAIDGLGEREVITRALQHMAPKDAACLLGIAQGLRYTEIAHMLGVTPGAAAARLTRARRIFGRFYDALKGEDN
ncbi:MAG: RNA polymerase sigma factor [Ktedonobacterales bacterium]